MVILPDVTFHLHITDSYKGINTGYYSGSLW